MHTKLCMWGVKLCREFGALDGSMSFVIWGAFEAKGEREATIEGHSIAPSGERSRMCTIGEELRIRSP